MKIHVSDRKLRALAPFEYPVAARQITVWSHLKLIKSLLREDKFCLNLIIMFTPRGFLDLSISCRVWLDWKQSLSG